ncbi:hypothetical protein [Metabacillus iocasae]|uniref:Uncharacterized protein n=1 Tax=Priestia iocasae TaxID=2291674 RepID=A0ABS2QXH2_9BACI|nr:hypothetical protein [Metabacillus iocasae]MBM7704189.1 hypothetical protein [Metabacillus iocasae]
MAANHSSNHTNKPIAKTPDTTNYQEELFMNAFIKIAKKGISDWEHLRKTKGNDG